MIYLAADHAGHEQKEFIAHKLSADNVSYEDFGTFSKDAVDYPRYAKQVARAVLKTKGMGLLFCGSGQGMAIAANRSKGIRAAVVWSKETAAETRQDNDANIISVPSRFVSNEEAWEIVRSFLSTTFSFEPRHVRRIKQVDES